MPLNFYSWEPHSWKGHLYTIVLEYYNTKQDTGMGCSLLNTAWSFYIFFVNWRTEDLSFLVYFKLDKLIRAINTSEISLYGVLPCFSLFNLWKHQLSIVKFASLYRNFSFILLLFKSSLIVILCSCHPAQVGRAGWTETLAGLPLGPHNVQFYTLWKHSVIFQWHAKAVTNVILVTWEFWQSQNFWQWVRHQKHDMTPQHCRRQHVRVL